MLLLETKRRLSDRGRERSNDREENRRRIEYLLKKYTMLNTDKILYYITHYGICIYMYT